MTLNTNARIAGVTSLFYIAALPARVCRAIEGIPNHEGFFTPFTSPHPRLRHDHE